MNLGKPRHKYSLPALLLGALVFFFVAASTSAQRLRDLPPPPAPPRYKPKPTPTPPPPSENEIDVVKISSNLVMVPVSVVDTKGQPVRGLQKDDFHLNEEGRTQQIAEIGNPEQVPLDIALLFDISSSVSQKGFFAFQQKAAASFLQQVLKPIDRAAIFTIGEEPGLVQPLAPAATAAAKLLTIPAATAPVPTAFYDTVSAAARYLIDNSAERHRRVIVVISDGDDNFSHMVRDMTIAEARASETGETTPAAARVNLQARHREAVIEVERAVQRADATFYSINPGGASVRLNQISMRAESGMQSIAEATGGAAFVPDSEKDLEPVFSQVAAELRGQYLLLYYSNSQSSAAPFRRIAVSVPAHAELRVRARQGYYPKK
jgi:Ca-activated chloride channel homolog